MDREQENAPLSETALVCLSVASLCFLTPWMEMAKGTAFYHLRQHPVRSLVAPTLTCEFALMAGLLTLAYIFERARLPTRPFLLLLSPFPLAMMAHTLLMTGPAWLSEFVQRHDLRLPAVATAVGYGLLLAWRREWLSRGLRALFLLLLAPLCVVYLRAGYFVQTQSGQGQFRDQRPAQASAQASGRTRVVWIIFDELGQRVAFERRPKTVAMPQLDRFRSECLHSENAWSPAYETRESIPSLLTGRVVGSALERGANELVLHFEAGGEAERWDRVENIFDAARGKGIRSALAGWYHPYGRVIGHSLDQCYWTGLAEPLGAPETIRSPFALLVLDRLQAQWETIPLFARLGLLDPEAVLRRNRVMSLTDLMRMANQFAGDREWGLVFLHLPMPHPPGIYSRAEGSWAKRPATYLDNLALTDRIFGELRGTMERAGLWDSSAVLVSSDHSWRRALWQGRAQWSSEEEAATEGVQDWRVPFLLKLPGQHEAKAVGDNFNTVGSRALLEAIQDGRIHTADEAAAWLSAYTAR